MRFLSLSLFFFYAWRHAALRPLRPSQERLLNLPAAGRASVCGAHRLRPGDRPLGYVKFPAVAM